MAASLTYDGPVVTHPAAPHTLAETGLSYDLIEQLTLKMLHFAGELSGAELGNRLKLPYSAITPVLEQLKHLHLVEVFGSGLIAGPAYVYRITDAGRLRALLFLEQSHYVGAAPVPFARYDAYMRAFAMSAPRSATRDRVREAFSRLVLNERVLGQLGPAVNGGHSMFVYGPPGNGKTVISQAIRKLLHGEIAIPHALEIEGSIVRFFDPVNHEPLDPPDADPASASLDLGERFDHRWVRCRRPMVMVGGELTLDSLELSYSPSTGFYRAPVQAVANGGVLVIDDFGRQQVAPRDLLNRWIVPLESRVDYLTLQSGQKFELPFMVLVVFATNIKPAELVDEAFLRRIHYKVFAESPTVAEFMQIFENCCRERQLEFDRSLVQNLLKTYYEPRRIPLRGCQPRDLIDQALSLAEYLAAPRQLSRELLEAACASYFVDEKEAPVVYS
jgi:hypothetical protein